MKKKSQDLNVSLLPYSHSLGYSCSNRVDHSSLMPKTRSKSKICGQLMGSLLTYSSCFEDTFSLPVRKYSIGVADRTAEKEDWPTR